MKMEALVLAESYCSVTWEKGFRYFDVVGRLMNLLVDDYDLQTDEQGLLAQRNVGVPHQIRVGAGMARVDFHLPDSNQLVVDKGWKVLNEFAELLEIATVSAIEIGTQHVSPLGSPYEVRAREFADWLLPTAWKIVASPAMKSAGLTLEWHENGIQYRTLVSPAKAVEDADPQMRLELPENALLLQSFATKQQESLSWSEFRPFARDALRWVESNAATLAAAVDLGTQ